MIATVRLIPSIRNGALLGLILLGAPFFVASAQEATSTAAEGADTTPTEAPPAARDLSAEALGIHTEGIPNSEDVIGDFVVGPGKFEAFMEPGDTRTMEMLITNRTGVDRRFELEIEDIRGSDDGSRSVVLLGDDRGPYSIKDYISVPATTFELRHGQRARIPVTISIPEDAEPGGFYGSVLTNTVSVGIEQDPAEGRAAARSPVIQRIGTLFFITVPGENIYEGQLQDFEIIPERSWYERGPFNFVITFENSGSSHLNPYGEIRITNMFGEEVGFVELEPWFALPQSVRLREVTWNRDLLYGKYTATIRLNRGYDDMVDTMSISFWVVPWKYLLAGLAGLFVIFFLIRSFFRTFEFRKKTN